MSSSLNEKFTINFGNTAYGELFDGRSELVKIVNDHIYIAGNYYQDISNIHPVLTYTPNKSNGFIMKMNLLGKPLWVKKIVADSLIMQHIAIVNESTDTYNEQYDGIYVVGNYINNTNIDINDIKLTASPTYYSSFVLKYDFNGNLGFVRKITANSRATPISSDISNNNIYSISLAANKYGIFIVIQRDNRYKVNIYNTITLTNQLIYSLTQLSPSTRTSAILGFDAYGNQLPNYNTIGYIDNTYNSNLIHLKLYNNNIYVIGMLKTKNTSEFTGITQGTQYIFTSKYDITGMLLWKKNIIGSSNNDNIILHLCVNNTGIYILGNYNGAIVSPPELTSFLIDQLPTKDTISFIICYNHEGIVMFGKILNNNIGDVDSILNSIYSDNFGIYLLGSCLSKTSNNILLNDYHKNFMTGVSSTKEILNLPQNTIPLAIIRYTNEGEFVSSNVVIDTPNLDYGFSLHIASGRIGVYYTTNIDLTGQSHTTPQTYFTLYDNNTLGTTIPPDDIMLVHYKQPIDSTFANLVNQYPYFMTKSRYALSRTE